MKVSRFNTEGYHDPTTYGAFTSIARQERAAGRSPNFRPVVYICSPYAGDITTNERNALNYCRMAYERGYLPLAPHAYFTRFLSDGCPEEREDGMFMGYVLLTKSAEMWVFGTNISSGMAREIKAAQERNMIIRHFAPDGREVEA